MENFCKTLNNNLCGKVVGDDRKEDRWRELLNIMLKDSLRQVQRLEQN